MTGQVTMLGLSRWTEKGGSYRTIQRFFYTVLPWAQVFWAFFREHLMDEQDTYLLAGDESVVMKAGDKTHGLDFFFSGLLKKAIPGLSFFTLALISTRQRRAYPIYVEQMIRTAEEKASNQVKKQARQAKSASPKGKPGRPKGSRNKEKAEVTLNPELTHIQTMVKKPAQNDPGDDPHHLSGTGRTLWQSSGFAYGSPMSAPPDFQAALRCRLVSAPCRPKAKTWPYPQTG